MGGARKPESTRQLDALICANWFSPTFRFYFGIQVLRLLEKSIPCEKCGAGSFRSCVTSEGQEIPYIHAIRARSRGRDIWERASMDISRIVCPICGKEIGSWHHSLHHCDVLEERKNKSSEKELPDDLIPYLQVLKEKYGSPEDMRKALLSSEKDLISDLPMKTG